MDALSSSFVVALNSFFVSLLMVVALESAFSRENCCPVSRESVLSVVVFSGVLNFFSDPSIVSEFCGKPDW